MAAASEVVFYAGIDLGDRKSQHIFLNAKGKHCAGGISGDALAELEALLFTIPKCRIAIEMLALLNVGGQTVTLVVSIG